MGNDVTKMGPGTKEDYSTFQKFSHLSPWKFPENQDVFIQKPIFDGMVGLQGLGRLDLGKGGYDNGEIHRAVASDIGLNFVLYWLISNSTGPVWSQNYNLLKSVSWFAHKLSWWQIWFHFPIIIHCKCSYTFKNVFKHVLLSNLTSLKWQLSNWIDVICCNFWSISFTRHNANVPGSISKTCMSS